MAITRIGFVDYKLENWHANTFLKIFREKLADRAMIVGCWSLDEADGKAWATKNNVPWHASVADLDKNVDGYMILAPSNPETHMELCERVFPMHKPTYVDKTFAPDRATAEAIFALADRCGIRMESTSALRYSNMQKEAAALGPSAVRHMSVWSNGSKFEEYAIHPVELVVSCMGAEAQTLLRRNDGSHSQLLINFSGGRTAVINAHMSWDAPFMATVTTAATTKLTTREYGPMFEEASAAIVDFLQARRPPIDRNETLIVRRILDAAMNDQATRAFVLV